MVRRHFEAAKACSPGCLHVLILATGSVASVKVPLIVEELLGYARVRVQVIATKAALTFFDPNALRGLRTGESQVGVWTDEDEWDPGYKIGDPILHIELRRWADVVLVAPCSANTLAKMAGGLCDNLATSVLRALDSSSVPTYVFPAMNTLMYAHPLTAAHLLVVRETLRYEVVGPVGKALACGDVGMGAMTDWREIVMIVVERFKLVKEAAEATTIM